MPTPAVTVLIPSYRARGFIARAVTSVLHQTLQDFEVVIISDDGQDYLRVLHSAGIRDPRIRMVSTNAAGAGVSRARNTGLAAARADIIAPLDADDIFYPEKLERMVPMALRHGFCSCAVRCTRYKDGVRHIIRDLSIAKSDGFLTPEAFLTVNIACNAMAAFDRRQVPVTWREDLCVMEDLVFSMAAFEYLPALYHLGTPLYEYIHTADSLSTALEAPGRFIAAKRRILRSLDDGTLGITKPATVTAFKNFITVSLKTEHAYEQAMKNKEAVTFLELLEKALEQNNL